MPFGPEIVHLQPPREAATAVDSPSSAFDIKEEEDDSADDEDDAEEEEEDFVDELERIMQEEEEGKEAQQKKKPPVVFDPSQSEARRQAVSQKVSLVQGPPGTGKTFVGVQICLELLKRGETFLVVCYTNHALDQFLGMLLDEGVTDIARLGGRSKSARMEPYQIQNLVKRGTFTTSNSRRAAYGRIRFEAIDVQADVENIAKGLMEDRAKLQEQERKKRLRRKGKLSRDDLVQMELDGARIAAARGNAADRIEQVRAAAEESMLPASARLLRRRRASRLKHAAIM